MPTELELSMATMFRDVVSKSIVLDLRKPADWERYDEIKNTAKAQTKAEVDRFETDRPAILAAARKDIIDKAGAKTFEHPTPFGIDKFDKSEIERQAVAKIFNDHQSRLIQIKTDETASYEKLRQDIHIREGVRDHARDGFKRATDMRAPQRER